MKRTLALSLILAALLSPLQAANWDSSTTGNQTVSENVTVTGTATVGNITFEGDYTTITVSGEGSIGGNGDIAVKNGTVVFDGVSRPMSSGKISIASGATLELTDGAQLVQSNWTNSVSVDIRGTLKLEDMNYSTGQLGGMGINATNLKMYGSNTIAESPRLEITKSGTSDRGVQLKTSGTFYTIAVADNVDFSWTKNNGQENIALFDIGSAGGSKLFLETGAGATFSLGKDIGAGLAVVKTGEGVLVLNSTLSISGTDRVLIVEEGTLRWGESARITSVGDGFTVGENGIFDLNGKNGAAGIAVTVYGDVINGQNNEMSINLQEGANFSITADATSGYSGTVVLTEGAEIDLDDYIFYNTIDISAGGTLKGASNHRGTIMVGADEDGITYLDSEALSTYASSLATTGSIEAVISEDFVAESPEFALQKGRLYAAGAVSITGDTGEESVSICGYETAFGALSAQGTDDGNISISNVQDVTLSNNHATISNEAAWASAGALYASGSVTIEAAGDVLISGNSSEANATSAGAIYAGGGDLTITAASITVAGNTTGSGEGDDFSGGALGGGADILLTSTEGDISITGNKAEQHGGALYADCGAVEINSATDIEISGNTATNGEGGAIYAGGDVSIIAGEGGLVSITDNEAGTNGGAIFSNGNVSLSGGPMIISGNTAGSAGGAIYAGGDEVSISADAGDIVFSDNTAGGVANDIELWGGKANLSATNGYTLELQGGVTGAGAINITSDADENAASTVKLGGYSSADEFSITNGRVVGITGDDGTPATIEVSTAVTLDSACLQDLALVADGATLSSTASTYVFDNVGSLLEVSIDADVASITSTVGLLEGFASMEGELAISLSLDFLSGALAAAEGAAVDIALTLCLDSTEITGDGFTFTLDEATLAMLEGSELVEFGFYIDGELQEGSSVTFTEGANVTFGVTQMTALIPEPTTTTLSLLALSALCLRRRRQK